ncbi:kinesin-like protein, putative [Plasmodium gallinaceum]|uniref:Kinesin-like protein, putative n=1 Tax=Plasmodium gallinaceum TaxID=5849 RepID=A0A1J1GQR8_PLAGA|nr:kinesin-like protein, putative [Plasmodium gallinaceum]CRG93386.1 kinesin-like protein, putative [Plasmodium gallinaceum]
MHKRAYSESVALSKHSLSKKNEIKRKNENELNNELKENENIRKNEKNLENVVVRIRKLDNNEKSTLHTDPNDKTALYFDKDFEVEKYNFDIVFDENDDNKTIFNKIGGHFIINNVCNGFKETIITYGQTGSGKTYTLFGSNKEYGIIYYFVHYLYKLHNTTTKRKTIYLSIYEILGDTLIDLISNLNEKNIEFYTEEYYLKTIKYSYKVVNIKSYEMAKKIIDTACLLRNVEATSQNMRSSRSHAIIQFFVNISESTLNNGVETIKDYYGVLTLVDLVGCEREGFNINKSENKNEKSSSKTLNSSLTSLNKMLRKMQMGNLDESDKRQSVLCKVLFNYIQKTCGVCLIFCFNPKLSQKNLTSSTLIMASDCKKIKSKRKQLIYVKSENKENFFKKIANDDYNSNNNIDSKDVTYNGIYEEKNRKNSNYIKNNINNINNTNIEKGKKIKDNCNHNNNSSLYLIYVNDDKSHIIDNLNKKKNDEKYTVLRNIVNDIINEQITKEEEKKNMIEQLKDYNTKLKSECEYWKKEANNYHTKLKILNKNYLKINEFLFNTLNANSVNSYNSSNFCNLASFKCDEEIYEPRKNQNAVKNGNYIFPRKKHEHTENIEKDNILKNHEKSSHISLNSNDISNSYNLYNSKNTSKKDISIHTNYMNYNVKKKNITELYQENENKLEKSIPNIKNNLSFNEKKNYEEMLANESNNQLKNSDQFYTQELINCTNNPCATQNYKKKNSKIDQVKEFNDNKVVIFTKAASTFPDEQDSNFKNFSNKKITKAESNINMHISNEDDLLNNLNKKKFITSNQEVNRDDSVNKPIISSTYYNKMNTENYNKKYSEKKDTKKNIMSFISNNDYKNLNNITVDSLATKIKNRMLKSRSLSVAR